MTVHNCFTDGESHAGAFKQSVAIASFKGMEDQVDLVVLDADRTQAAAGERAPAVPLGSFQERGDG